MWEKRLSKKTTLKSFGGKSVHGKKSLRFGMVSDVDQKITKSFGGKKSRLRRLIFSH